MFSGFFEGDVLGADVFLDGATVEDTEFAGS